MLKIFKKEDRYIRHSSNSNGSFPLCDFTSLQSNQSVQKIAARIILSALYSKVNQVYLTEALDRGASFQRTQMVIQELNKHNFFKVYQINNFINPNTSREIKSTLVVVDVDYINNNYINKFIQYYSNNFNKYNIHDIINCYGNSIPADKLVEIMFS